MWSHRKKRENGIQTQIRVKFDLSRFSNAVAIQTIKYASASDTYQLTCKKRIFSSKAIFASEKEIDAQNQYQTSKIGAKTPKTSTRSANLAHTDPHRDGSCVRIMSSSIQLASPLSLSSAALQTIKFILFFIFTLKNPSSKIKAAQSHSMCTT